MIDEATKSALTHRLATEQSANRLPSVAAGLTRDGALIWSATAGSSDGRRDGQPTTMDTQYRIGSITKTFIAVQVMRMRDEGLLDLQDRIDAHLPEVDFGQVTIAQLLSHTAGLQAETNGDWWERVAGGSWDELLAQKPRLIHRPGSLFHYSNVGFGVLGELIARLRNKPWQDVIAAELLEPLGLHRTSTRPQQPAATGWAVHPHADLLHVEPEHDAVAMAPAGQFWSTITDLSRWATFLAGHTHDLLAAGTLAEMCRPIAINDPRGAAWTVAHGLGVQLWNIDGVRFVGHGGSMPGFLADLRVNVETGDGAVVMVNATSGMRGLAADLLTLLTERSPQSPKPWYADADQQARLDLTGNWYWGTTVFTLAVAADGGVVLGTPGAGRGARFRPVGDGSWVGLDGYYTGEALDVVRDPDGVPRYLDVASFRFSRTPYDPVANLPGGADELGWH